MQPEITVRELVRRMNALLGLAVGMNAVRRFLKRCGLSFNKMTRVADERARPDVKRRRERWMRHQGRIGPERLVFLDETCVKTNMAPLSGWGPKGERLPGPAPFGHWNTSTLIAALRHDRIDAPSVFDGPVNGEVFLTWVARELVPTLRAGELVVIDNPVGLPQESERPPGDPCGRRARALPGCRRTVRTLTRSSRRSPRSGTGSGTPSRGPEKRSDAPSAKFSRALNRKAAVQARGRRRVMPGRSDRNVTALWPPAATSPALPGAFHLGRHQDLVCGCHGAGIDRIAFV